MIGQKINNYELRRLLGEGGMGAVYFAEHPVLGRRVAIKVLRRDLVQDEKLVTRFINEARAADAIRHPNIVQVMDVGLLADGLPYIVMELLEGHTLGARIQAGGPLALGDALELAHQAAAAVTAAHAVGIVHRDLKPDNMFLVPDPSCPGGERVKVLDFGIAKLRAELTGSDMKTKTGAVMGTPAYMSPEQCLGRSNEVDHRTDVYALGVILFEMLCGVPPFVGEGFGEVLVMHMTQPPPSPRAINPAVTPAVEQIVLRALSKRKEDRFATMAELEAALGACKLDPAAPPSFAPVAGVGTTSVLPFVPPAPARPPTGTTGQVPRPTGRMTGTTLSSAAGPVAGSPSADEELVPVRSKGRLGLVALGVAAVGAVIAAGMILPQKSESPVSADPLSPAEIARPAAPAPAAVVPPIVPVPPVETPPPPPAVTPPTPVEKLAENSERPEKAKADKPEREKAKPIPNKEREPARPKSPKRNDSPPDRRPTGVAVPPTLPPPSSLPPPRPLPPSPLPSAAPAAPPAAPPASPPPPPTRPKLEKL